MNLVTGAGGFLGRYLCEQLIAAGESVRGFARGDYPDLERSGVEMFRGDLRDESSVAEACRGIDTVYHVAAVAGIWGQWDDYYQINTVGTLNVIDACRRQGVRKLVFCSSPSVTFDGNDQQGVDESSPYPSRWLCHYPRSKALAEQAVLAANSSELLTCALRPHLIWGPRDQHLIPRLMERAKSGKLRVVGEGTNLIDTTYVENAAAAHILAARALYPRSPACGKAYFISQDEPVNCWEWINQILSLAGIAPVSKRMSFKTAWRVGSAMEVVYRMLRISSEPRMTRFLAAQLSTSHYFDLSAARRDLGYSPQISMDEGMRRLANSLVNL